MLQITIIHRQMPSVTLLDKVLNGGSSPASGLTSRRVATISRQPHALLTAVARFLPLLTAAGARYISLGTGRTENTNYNSFTIVG